MYQWKDKGDRSGQNQSDGLDLLHLLESPDQETVESVKNVIQENLYGTKDPKFLNGLVDYYIAVKSKRSLDILLRLKEPYDKYLFDKISELMKAESYRYESLQLLCNIVYKQPTWLHRIATHRIMNTLLHLLKTDVCAANLMSALFILISLLPLIPSKCGPHLPDTFEIFSRLASWNIKKPSAVLDVYMLHLQVGVYSLFHRLYGMFPCNFLAYLRSFYGGREFNEDNFRVFSLFIKPMLERVRLHPLLVTASKETELSIKRWKKMDYHDIIVECSSISLDAIEGTQEGPQRNANPIVSASLEQNGPSNHDSGQFVSFSSQSSTSMTLESESLVTDSMSYPSVMWSPSHAVSVTTPPPILNSSQLPTTVKGEWDAKCYASQGSTDENVPLDIAIEAKPDVLKLECVNSNTQVIESNRDTDKEVSELTSSRNVVQASSTCGNQDCTPFCSTTQNLTDEPVDALQEDGAKGVKNNEEDPDEMYNSLQETDMDAFVPSFSRFRYLSHCGPPPDIPAEYLKRPKVYRSKSCPAELCPSIEAGFILPAEEVVQTIAVTCTSNAITTASTFIPLNGQNIASTQERLLTYQDLIPMALNSAVLPRCEAGSFESQNAYLNSLSPPELLDHYIQLGSDTYLSQLNVPLTSSVSTDWTHFGGKPPADEITILRNRLKLLHCQLSFERHRKNVHSERNRSILGRSKRSRMQEDHIAALKEQISLLEQDNQSLKSEISYHSKLLQKTMLDKTDMENELNNRISKIKQENTQLSYANTKLQNLLVTQKEENDEIREGCKRSQAAMTDLRFQLELASREILRCQKIEKEAIFLSKQVVLLQELNSHYNDKIDHMKETPFPDIGEDLMNATAFVEIKDLKQKLDSKNHFIEANKTKIAEMEQTISSLKAKQKDQLEAFEKVKLLHKNEIMVQEDRLADLRKVSFQKDAHILDLNKDIEAVSKKISKLEAMVGAASISHASTTENVPEST